MKRVSILLSLTVAALLGFSAAGCMAAEENGRMAATDRSQVDADYAIQGEYQAEMKTDDGETRKLGMQVIALGDGKFDIVGYPGGLPGDGWIGEGRKFEMTAKTVAEAGSVAEAESVDGKVVVIGREEKPVGTIADGKISLTFTRGDAERKLELKRIERKSPTMGLKAPDGATVVFDVKSKTNATDHDANEAGLIYSGFYTDAKFAKPYTAHIEFMLQYMPYARGQGRSNSGCYIFNAYEVQVLDSFGLEGVDNECGGIYQIASPKVNMCLPPLQWQTYDIEFTPPIYEGRRSGVNGKKVVNARATIKHNGVLIHDDLELPKNTPGQQGEADEARPIFFQGHGCKVQYRNIWVKEKE